MSKFISDTTSEDFERQGLPAVCQIAEGNRAAQRVCCCLRFRVLSIAFRTPFRAAHA